MVSKLGVLVIYLILNGAFGLGSGFFQTGGSYQCGAMCAFDFIASLPVAPVGLLGSVISQAIFDSFVVLVPCPDGVGMCIVQTHPVLGLTWSQATAVLSSMPFFAAGLLLFAYDRRRSRRTQAESTA